MIDDLIYKIIQSIEISYRNHIGKKLTEYVDSQYSKIKYSKNILNRSRPERFEKQYIPLVIENNQFRTKFREPHEVFENYPNIIITGPAGTGKSTFLKYIFLTCVKNNYKLPVLIDLRSYNLSNHDTLEEFFANHIEGSHVKDIDSWLKVFKKGKFVFLLDGYEEIQLELKQKFVKDLENFISRNSVNNFVITSRSGTEIEFLLQFYHFKLLDLDRRDIVNFIELVSPNKEFRQSLIEIIEQEESSHLLEFLRNPLFLSIYILHFQSSPNLSLLRSSFFRSIFDYLYSQHDSVTKIGYVREKLSGLSKDEIEEILKIFSFLCFSQGNASFSKDTALNFFNTIKKQKEYLEFENEKLLYDLVVSLCILIQEGSVYYFLHYSFVEYFTVLFIRDLNETSKSKIYQKICSTDFYLKNGISENFWILSKEIDNYGFSKYFILNKLKEINDRVKSSNSRLSFPVLLGLDYNNKTVKNDYYQHIYTIDYFVLKQTNILSIEDYNLINEYIFHQKRNIEKYEYDYFRNLDEIIFRLDDYIINLEKELSNSSDEFIDLLNWE